MTTTAPGLCQCGCGGKTSIAPRSHKDRGIIKGQYYRFIHNHHQQLKNGGVILKNGYRLRLVKFHPRATKGGYVYEHILIAEKAIDKPLPDGVIVHHHDKTRSNNANTNLVICEDRDYHTLIHVRTRAFQGCGNPDFRRCAYCHQWDAQENLKVYPGKSYHGRCVLQHQKATQAGRLHGQN